METQNIDVWFGEISSIETEHQTYEQILAPSEQQHASEIKNEKLRKHYIDVRSRLRLLLADLLQAVPNQIRIAQAEHGKPHLVDYPEVVFNISHTENKMIVAVGYKCLLGVDIEICKPRENLPALVEKCFGTEEKIYWQQLPDTQKIRAFYQFWTRKEAFVKATGRGLALGLKQCVINPEQPTTLLRIPEHFGQTDEWLISDIHLGELLCGALAVKNKNLADFNQLNIVVNPLFKG